MKYYGKSKEVTEGIINLFKSGDIPNKLANIFINMGGNRPVDSWSWSNRLNVAMRGTDDARGFKQWLTVGRKVSKGAKALYILAPLFFKKTETADDGTTSTYNIPYAFKSIPVFAIESTEICDEAKWEAASNETEKGEFINNLPLVDVAKTWGLNVDVFNGNNSPYAGYYLPGQKIALGVENLSTWAHELVHAADDKTGNIKLGRGQDPDNEIVAELGGAVLLTILGHDTAADLGGCYKYIEHYSKGKDPAAKALSLVDRLCKAVNLILETAHNFNLEPAA